MEELDRPLELRADTEKDYTENRGAHPPPANGRGIISTIIEVEGRFSAWEETAEYGIKASLSAGLGKLNRSW